MKMDRNIDGNKGRGKYALVLMREVRKHEDEVAGDEISAALEVLQRYGALDYGNAGTHSEFFVMRLKDKNSGDGLAGYAAAAMDDDPEWAREVAELAGRAGHNSPYCKTPD